MPPTALALGALLLAAVPPPPTAPGNPPSAGAAAARKPGAAPCSASGLSSEPAPAQPPLPPPVESMRRRIVAAAVACDYVALAVLARENGSRFSFSTYSISSDDPAAFWRKRESYGEPVLARLVKVLQLPHAQREDRYIWPALSLHPAVTPEDVKVIGQLFPADEIAAVIADPYASKDYQGTTLVILANGDWLEGERGGWSDYPWGKEKRP